MIAHAVLDVAATLVVFAWVLVGVGLLYAAIKRDEPLTARLRNVDAWLTRPVLLILTVRAAGAFARGDTASGVIHALVVLLLIVVDHRDDDGRWKRLRRRATVKVRQVAGRLVITPAPA